MEYRAHSREHSDLTLDVTPFARCLEIVSECSIKLFTHVDNPVRHGFDFSLPLLIQFRSCENGVGNPGTMQRRVGVHRPNDDLQLTIDPLFLFRIFSR